MKGRYTMRYTNKISHYVTNDKPRWLGDFNAALC